MQHVSIIIYLKRLDGAIGHFQHFLALVAPPEVQVPVAAPADEVVVQTQRRGGGALDEHRAVVNGGVVDRKLRA